jgi:O-antigen/teichoic acid export membrane protein
MRGMDDAKKMRRSIGSREAVMECDRPQAADGEKLARISLTGIGIRTVGAAGGFLFNVILARTLGKTGTGSVMLYLNFATMIGLIATGGMDVVGLRELSRHADDTSQAPAVLAGLFSTALASVLLFSIGGFAFLFFFGASLAGMGGVGICFISALMLALTALQKIVSDWLIALREFGTSQLVFYFLNRLASLILIAAIVGLSIGPRVSGQTFVAVYAAGLLLAVLYAISRLSAHFSGRVALAQWRPAMPLLRDGIACAMQNAAFILLNLSPFLLLGALSTSSEIGLFGVSQRLVAIVILALTTISQLAMRNFSRAFGARDFSSLARGLTVSVRLTFAAAIGLSLPLIVFAPLWVLVFGKSFAPAAPTLALLSVAICAQCLGMPFQAALLTTNHERPARNVTIVCAAIGIALNAVLIPRWGAVGAALGTGMGLALQSIGHSVYTLHVLPFRFRLTRFAIIPRRAQPGSV